MDTAEPTVPNYLVQAILVTLFCCMPTGVAAIIYSSQVNSKLAIGDWHGAEEASAKARLWCWISFWAGVGSSLVGAALLAYMGLLSWSL